MVTGLHRSAAPREQGAGVALADANGKATSLGELLTTPINVSNTAKPRGVLLIFYRGYW